MLLFGYFYSHRLSQIKSAHIQAGIHLSVLIAAAIMLPFGVSSISTIDPYQSPIPWVITTLLLSVGLPYFALSSTTNLVMAWAVKVFHANPEAAFKLYAPSNLGSMMGLLCYPLLIEPSLTITTQKEIWSSFYVVEALLILTCAFMMLNTKHGTKSSKISEPASTSQRIKWLILSGVPCGIMIGTNTAITVDLASIPLLWVIPVSIYLATYIIAFGNTKNEFKLLRKFQPALAIITSVFFFRAQFLPAISILIYFINLFICCLAMHLMLARAKPEPKRLTEFYLFISIGGVLGSAFASLISPLIFKQVFELPLLLVIAALLPYIYDEDIRPKGTRNSHYFGAIAALVAVCFFLVVERVFSQLVETLSLWGGTGVYLSLLVALGVSTVLYIKKNNPESFKAGSGFVALAVIATALNGFKETNDPQQTMHLQRTFFGVHRVTTMDDYRLGSDEGYTIHTFTNGTTIHGMQVWDDKYRYEPTTYYTPLFPIIESLNKQFKNGSFAVVGLGAGTIAAYSKPNQKFVFFDIDPVVAKIAGNKNYFTYLSNAKGKIDIRIVDGRIGIERSDEIFSLIILDAFTSDSIPTHLLTREAVEIYRTHLVKNGVLAFHISNRNMDLRPMLFALAKELGMNISFAEIPAVISKAQSPSIWALMSENKPLLNDLKMHGWQLQDVSKTATAKPWSDDYSNILSILRFGYFDDAFRKGNAQSKTTAKP